MTADAITASAFIRAIAKRFQERHAPPLSDADAAWEQHKAAEPCTIPPEGWWCSRVKGHEGPCAARNLTGATS